jgi:hypothetical protein
MIINVNTLFFVSFPFVDLLYVLDLEPLASYLPLLIDLEYQIMDFKALL